MADNNPRIGATIVLDGEKEYKAALRDINAAQKENRSELALTAAQYDENDTSIAAFTARQKVLTDAVELQQRKVATLRGAMTKAAEVYGESSAQTRSWQIQLNYAEADLEKMTKAVQENDAAMQRAERNGASLANAVNAIADAAGVSIPPALQGMVDKLDGVSASGAALVTTLVGVTTAFTKCSTKAAVWADDILTLSQTTNLSVEELQRLQYASNFVDVEVDTLANSMTKMEKNMLSAASGTGSAADAFAQLKVRVTDGHGNLRDMEDTFYEIVDALGKVENETERDALAMTLLGKSAKDLNPLINAGSGYLRELGDEAERMGAVLDDEAVQELGKLKDEMDSLNVQMDATKLRLGTVLLPLLINVLDVVTSINPEVLKTVAVVSSVVAIIVMMVKTVADVTKAVSTVTNAVSGGIPTWLKVVAVITTIVGLLIVLLSLIAAIKGKANDATAVLNNATNFKNNVAAQSAQMTAAYRSVPQYAKGTDFHPGGLAVVGENGPELVQLPRGSKVYPNGSATGETNNYVFRVDDIETYNRIERKLKFERQSRRKGYVGV